MRAAKTIGVAAVLACTAVTGCSDGGGDNTARSSVPTGLDLFYQQKPSWKDCEDDFECATVQVPLDYAKPSGEKIGISVIRLPAADNSNRIGSLLTNPGGPGGSGVDFVRQAGRAFGADLRRRFDIVGFDPRGVAGSAAVRCNSAAQLDAFFATDASPDDRRETEQLGAQGEKFAQNCETKAEDKLPYVGTVNAARDMDVLRAALGDDKLTYYGASYGTYLGAFYAEQFPKNFRALALDGAVDPNLSSTDLLIEQAKGFETALRAFAEDCVRTNNCPFGTSADAVIARISTFLAETDKQPLTSSRDSRKVTESLAVMGIARSLYVKEYWPVLRQALTQAMQNKDGTTLLGLADEMVEREADGTYSNQTDANMAVNCVDKPNPPDLAAYGKAAAEAEKVAPRFGPFVVWGGVPCVYWPTQTDQEPKPLTANGAAPILVIGTTRDPATPYKWSENLADQLSSGVLLTYEGDGHTAYLQGNPCITKAIGDYLITADPPDDGTRCS
ncbi:alpha/beta hydrolase [Actinomadura sp. 6K520]|uniref:alpha/beta hydrolase n=1 Tax=Actinomadura sp. 6K520 TaxID=2530364 RepID=UPI0014044357|nr:alpha/beta hydrolase [Actinomadura sp. 6K520]